MKFFIDTASVAEIREAEALGVLDGVTTNPSLYAKEKGAGDYSKLIAEICTITDGPVSAEVTSPDLDGMLREGRAFAKIAKNVYVKVPMSLEGLKAIRQFKKEGIRTNCTLIFSAGQALLAAKAGASLLSPFVGRLDDISTDGMNLVEEIVTILGNYPDLESEVLVASVRHPMHVIQSALMGADIATMPLKVIQQLAQHPLTDSGIQKFTEDWNKAQAANAAAAVEKKPTA